MAAIVASDVLHNKGLRPTERGALLRSSPRSAAEAQAIRLAMAVSLRTASPTPDVTLPYCEHPLRVAPHGSDPTLPLH
jgi:hypothetical protein